MSAGERFQSELNALREKGLARRLRDAGEAALNLSSNDYLNLSRHPAVVRAAHEALDRFGAGATSSRLLAGTVEAHRALETDVAAFMGKERALVFSSGYHANTGVLPALAGVGDAIFFDRLSHASLIDGIRLSGAKFFPFRHNDAVHLRELLSKKAGGFNTVWVVTESVFSMDGDRAALHDVVAAAKAAGALVYLDEAHAVGVIGPEGRGLAAEAGVAGDVDVLAGTLSKTLGSQGGFVASSGTVIDLLISTCRSFLFTTALAPAAAAASRAALALLPSLEEERRRLSNNAARLRAALKTRGFSTLASASQIIPIWTGSVEETLRFSEHLLSKGFFVPSIRPPTVPPAQGRVRVSLTSALAENELDAFAAAAGIYPARPQPDGREAE
jgi:8-amino-7-oxononanoate synthase